MAAVVAHAAERRGEVASVGAVVLAGAGHRVPGILSAERQRQIALPYRGLQRVGYERIALEVQPAVRTAVRVHRRRYAKRSPGVASVICHEESGCGFGSAAP